MEWYVMREPVRDPLALERSKAPSLALGAFMGV
jgi:hypothetical protein